MTALRQWLLDEEPSVLPKSPLGQAIAYALRHWQALLRYLEDGGNLGNQGGMWAEAAPWQGKTHSLQLTLPPLAVVGFRRR